jgi:molecular chaperone DnaK
VTFDIDANGILNVSAKDLGTGKEQSIKIQSSSGLTEAEIKKMQQQAKEHESDDRKKRELAETKNKADHVLYSTEKFLKENEAKIQDADKQAITAALDGLRKAKDSGDLPTIQRALEALEQAQHKMSQSMYEGAKRREGPGGPGGAEGGGPAGAGAGAGAGKKGGDEDVQDADFEVKG